MCAIGPPKERHPNCKEASSTGHADPVAGSSAKVQECRVAARRSGIDRECPLIREPCKIVRPTGFGPGPRKSGAAKRLHAHHSADHIAIDVSVADRSVVEHLPPKRLQPGLHAQGQPKVAGADRLQNRWRIGGSIPRDMQDGTEFLARELRGALQFNEMRSKETAARV